MPTISRRRVLSLCAAAAGLPLLPAGATQAQAALATWRGQALGATCTLQIHAPDKRAADALLRQLVAEARRLERIFSLYDPASTLVALNRGGVLADPPAELVALVRESLRIGELTGGAFDISVQPLWSLYLTHFSRPDADPAGPAASALQDALDRVGQQRIRVSPDRIALPRGMSLTLNGIAQGYVTDRLVDMLRQAGIDQSMVDMGEPRVIGRHPGGRPWDVAIESPQGGPASAHLDLVDRAVATSGAYGFRFDPQGRFNHLFRPADGSCAWRHASVSVVAASATLADGLSTAFSLMADADIRAVAGRAGIDAVLLVERDGGVVRLSG